MAEQSLPRVTTSTVGFPQGYHQARYLECRGLLERVIHAYPARYVSRRYGLDPSKLDTMLGYGVRMRALNSLEGRIGAGIFGWACRRMHREFALRVGAMLPESTNIVTGFSSYMVEVITAARRRGIYAVVDHGSLHQRFERRMVREEAEIWGIPAIDEIPDWVIEREDLEFASADRIIVQSRAASRSMIAEGVRPDKIEVNGLGVDLRLFSAADRPQNDVFRIIHVGSAISRKGLPYLLQALAELKLPRSELVVVGTGYASSPLKPIFERHVGENVRFVGKISLSELIELYRQSSVFVLPSIADGFGLVVTEAMACGLPVVVTENVGAAELVRDGVSGFILPIRDVEAIKSVLLTLYEDPERRVDMGRAARAAVSFSNSWDDTGARLVSILKRVLEKELNECCHQLRQI